MALKTRIAAAVLGAGLALTVGVPGAAAGDRPRLNLNPFVLASGSSPHCLEVAGWSADNGAAVQQWSCHGGNNQSWQAPGGGQVVNAHTGKCLEIGGWSTDNGAPAQQWDCNGGANQKWEWSGVPGGGEILRNVWSGKCLDVPGGVSLWGPGYFNGVRMQQWDCWNGKNQQWFVSSPGNSYPPVDY
ncbi:RICIN domain-containing protein [Kitasatospora sp. NPDC057692]|uniref:RICIN domain-containing protein n=1 Tax=Kitasatospora sp. NPDC057692 TaxID=3346215 RepID=UPI0036C39AB0